MIDYLSGNILLKRTSGLVLGVSGVGYGVSMPLSHLLQVGELGEKLNLWIFTRVREDQLALYGFLEESDKQVFELLLSCNGIGPKVALAIMSTMSTSELIFSIREKNTGAFELVPGIGKRTAEKLVVDLQSKVEKLGFAGTLPKTLPKKSMALKLDQAEEEGSFPTQFKQDLISALNNLGFKDKDIHPVLETICSHYDGEDFSTVTRKALSLISSGNKKKPDLSTLF